jgi:hypothetical protein
MSHAGMASAMYSILQEVDELAFDSEQRVCMDDYFMVGGGGGGGGGISSSSGDDGPVRTQSESADASGYECSAGQSSGSALFTNGSRHSFESLSRSESDPHISALESRLKSLENLVR